MKAYVACHWGQVPHVAHDCPWCHHTKQVFTVRLLAAIPKRVSKPWIVFDGYRIDCAAHLQHQHAWNPKKFRNFQLTSCSFKGRSFYTRRFSGFLGWCPPIITSFCLQSTDIFGLPMLLVTLDLFVAFKTKGTETPATIYCTNITTSESHKMISRRFDSENTAVGRFSGLSIVVFPASKRRVI